MEGAKPSVGSIELPTGFFIDNAVVKQIQYRELAGPEEDILASNMKVSEKLSTVMSNCTMAIGSVTDPHQIRKIMEKMVVTDRWFYLVQLRVLSLGSSYQLISVCPVCSTEDKLLYDLRQVSVKNPPPASELFKEITLSNGQKVRFMVADSSVDAKIEKMANETNGPTIGLFSRITEIDDKPADLSDVKNMTMKVRAEIRKAIDAAEGEFDDEFDAECPKCNHKYKGQLQIDGRTFFSP